MRYKYKITDKDGKAEEVEAMSYKKMLKNLLLKSPQFNGSITYLNKKDHPQTKIFREGKRFYSGGGLSNEVK